MSYEEYANNKIGKMQKKEIQKKKKEDKNMNNNWQCLRLRPLRHMYLLVRLHG